MIGGGDDKAVTLKAAVHALKRRGVDKVAQPCQVTADKAKAPVT
jgi:hypothetical protein